MTANEASRMIWYSLSVSVMAGATVIESPVWTPMIKILNRTNDHALVLVIAHDLHLEFFPAEQTFLDQDLVNGRDIDAIGDDRSNSSRL